MARAATPRRTSTRWKIWALIAAMVVLVVALVIFLVMNRVRDSCSSEILVNGQSLDFSAAVAKLKLDAKASPPAQAEIKDRLQFYLDRSSQLCRDVANHRRAQQDYVAQSDLAARWYMAVEDRVASNAFADVTAANAPGVRDALEQLPGSDAPRSVARVTLTSEDHAIIPDGATIRAREGLRLALDIPTPRYVYVLDQDTEGAITRVFPSSRFSSRNPVQGHIEIPEEAGRFLRVAGPKGTERIYIFFADKPDSGIEAQPEIALTTDDGKNARTALRNTIVVRKLLAEPPPPKSATSKPAPIDVRSRFGSSTFTYTLDNVGG